MKELVERLCEELLRVEIPKPNAEKAYSLAIRPDIIVEIKELDPLGFSLQTSISRCPEKRREEFFIYLMKANFLGQGTGGARIGLDNNAKSLTLSAFFPYEVNYHTFKEGLEDFVNYTIYWRDETARFEREQ